MAALALAPLSIIGPLHAIDILFNLIFAFFILKEKFTKLDVLLTFLCGFFAAGVVVFGPHIDTPSDFTGRDMIIFWGAWARCTFTLVSLSMLATGIVLLIIAKQKERKIIEEMIPIDDKSNAHALSTAARDVQEVKLPGLWRFKYLIYPINQAITTCWSQLCARVVGIQIVNMAKGTGKDIETWEFVASIVALGAFAFGSIFTMSVGIKNLDNRFFFPCVFSLQIIIHILSSAAIFNELKNIFSKNIFGSVEMSFQFFAKQKL